MVCTGECSQMCPDAEWALRLRSCDIHFFETLQDQPHRPFAVKQFRRIADAGDRLSIRPPSVLERTIDHLWTLLDGEGPWLRVYNFVADRTRAVRQDLGLQYDATNLSFLRSSIRIHEQVARFHILAGYKLPRALATGNQQVHDFRRSSGEPHSTALHPHDF